MAQVAIHQDRAQAERTHYVYVQHARVISRKGKTVRCEEITDARVTPSENGSHQQILKLDGRLLLKRKYVSYTLQDVPKPSTVTYTESDSDSLHVTLDSESSMDRDLVENMRLNLTNDKSKDGIGAGLFPLTSKSQADYAFQLVGEEQINGRKVFHITFQPKDKDDYGWKGDAYIDATAYQPVVVRTSMARKLPFAVRTLLGTSLPHLGFTVTYAPRQEGLWFPTSFGTEFKLHVLFFINREIILGAENGSFEKTHVTSTIVPTESNPSAPTIQELPPEHQN